MRLRLHAIVAVAVEAELGTRLAEFGAQLRGCEDGDREDLGSAQELLRRRDDFGELVDGRPEFLLQVADTFCSGGSAGLKEKELGRENACLARQDIQECWAHWEDH